LAYSRFQNIQYTKNPKVAAIGGDIDTDSKALDCEIDHSAQYGVLVPCGMLAYRVKNKRVRACRDHPIEAAKPFAANSMRSVCRRSKAD
jgi:hypothetical protein